MVLKLEYITTKKNMLVLKLESITTGFFCLFKEILLVLKLESITTVVLFITSSFVYFLLLVLKLESTVFCL